MNEIDTYLDKITSSEDQKALKNLRVLILQLLPGATECISYGMPAFKIGGKAVAGFAAFKNHLTFFPFSGSTLDGMAGELAGYSYTKSGVHFTPEKPLPDTLIEKIIKKRLSERK